MSKPIVHRLLPIHYHALADQHGYIWLGPEVPNNRTHTGWRCPEGHEWSASYDSLSRSGCPHCGGTMRLAPARYHALAGERGIEWLGPLPSNVTIKTLWRCSRGHEWDASYATVSVTKYGCSACTKNKALGADDFVRLAQRRGFQWLGPTACNAQTKTQWQCQQGHVWSTTYNSIHNGTGCRICGGYFKRVPWDYATLAEERTFIWIGPVADNANARTGWQCLKGHVWHTTYNAIKQGGGCPRCDNRVNGVPVSKPQLALCDMLKGELNHPVRRYRVDVALERAGVHIAVEYDSAYFHDPVKDKKRDAILHAEGWRVLRIKSGTLVPSLAELNVAIARLVSGDTYGEIRMPDWGGD